MSLSSGALKPNIVCCLAPYYVVSKRLGPVCINKLDSFQELDSFSALARDNCTIRDQEFEHIPAVSLLTRCCTTP